MKNINEIEKDLNNISERLESIQKDVNLIVSGIKQEPEFKVGQWVFFDGTSHQNIHRISKINSDGIGIDDYGSKLDLDSGYYRFATKEEIEAHLKKICDKKYIGRRVKSLINEGYIETIECFNYYGEENDEINCIDINHCQMTVYCKGKFAEIIPNKKKLPKTKGEFNTFLGHWCSRHTKTTKEFLNDYED